MKNPLSYATRTGDSGDFLILEAVLVSPLGPTADNTAGL